ncbi:MAG TPA: phosphate ABC transporter permease subunit PstC [Candidatus Dormibacteraeota bacterium]|nr:phosphate ABC transporter permease subunit PstC [Candidatus Dormibacteraeota bacterium]
MSVLVRRVQPAESRRTIVTRRATADLIYRSLASGAGILTLVLLVLIGLFLVFQSAPAFRLAGLNFLTTKAWQPDGTTHQFGIEAIMYWTLVIAVIALVIAVPVSIATALFINEYAPRSTRRTLTALVDLLAAVPSVIYGIWGLVFLEAYLVQVASWLTDNASFIPIFKTDIPIYAGSAFIAGVVVSLMVQPICTSVMREVFAQAPPAEREAALALGATRWGMIRTVVLPFGAGGMIGGSMLGLGRALGETIAVALIISPVTVITFPPQILGTGANSVAALIALQFGEASRTYGIPALMAAGLSLFVVTLLVNFVASLIVARSRSGKGVEI